MRYIFCLFFCIFLNACSTKNAPTSLVIMSDFGTKDGAVAEMKGVINEVSSNIQVVDLTHEITEYNIFEGAYRLLQTAPYWQKGTVFVCIVDPGVGTKRKSIVLHTKADHFFVGPDNGLFSLIAEKEGVEAIREIDESKNRRKESFDSHTFYGRDVFAFTGAKLASKIINFEGVGMQLIDNQLVKLKYQASNFNNGIIKGSIPVLDIQYGNVWTNIDKATFSKLNIGVSDKIKCKIFEGNQLKFEAEIPFQNTFGEVKEGEKLCYLNSLMNLSLAINMGDFAQKYNISSGENWKIEVSK